MKEKERVVENKEKKSEDQLAKIAITKEADRVVNEIIARVSDGFDAGKVVKQGVVSSILLRFFKECTEADIHDIRMQFFDPLQLMEALLKKAKETGELPDSIRELLYKQFNTANPSPKRLKKNLKDHAINDSVESDGDTYESR